MSEQADNLYTLVKASEATLKKRMQRAYRAQNEVMEKLITLYRSRTSTYSSLSLQALLYFFINDSRHIAFESPDGLEIQRALCNWAWEDLHCDEVSATITRLQCAYKMLTDGLEELE